MLFICWIKRESEEKSVSTGKLFQMLTTRSVKNKERAVQLECCFYSLCVRHCWLLRCNGFAVLELMPVARTWERDVTKYYRNVRNETNSWNPPRVYRSLNVMLMRLVCWPYLQCMPVFFYLFFEEEPFAADCSRYQWALPAIWPGGNREIWGWRPRVGKSFLEKGQWVRGLAVMFDVLAVSSPSSVRGRALTANAFWTH